MTPFESPLIDDYLNRLRAALAGLPEARRAEIIDAVAQHIADARIELAVESEAAVRTVLDHLGEPDDIAADAFEVEQVSMANGIRRRDLLVSRKALIVGVAAVVLVVGGVVSGFALSGGPTPPRYVPPTTTVVSVTVPNVVGLSTARAYAALQATALRVKVRSVPATIGVPPGSVVRQSPPAGTMVAAGTTVTVTSAAATSSLTTTTTIAP
jgi:hypothetical protein